MRKAFLAVGLSAVLVLPACTTNKETAGTAGGAVIGALAGAALARKGDTSGRYAGAAIGGLVGGFIGNRIGAALDRNDREMAQLRARQAMDAGRTGHGYSWRNPRTGNGGVITPRSRPYQAKRGPKPGPPLPEFHRDGAAFRRPVGDRFRPPLPDGERRVGHRRLTSGRGPDP